MIFSFTTSLILKAPILTLSFLDPLITESAVRVEPASTKVSTNPDAKIIRVLDYKQEQLARSLGGGHRLFCGVAGSGKTLILLSRAKILANELFTQKVLILCFNITLAAYLRSQVNHERITVHHFHEWAKSIWGGLPKKCCLNTRDNSQLREVLDFWAYPLFLTDSIF